MYSINLNNATFKKQMLHRKGIVENTFSEWKANVKCRFAELHEELNLRTNEQCLTEFVTVAEVDIGQPENGPEKAQNHFRLFQGHIATFDPSWYILM